MFKAILDRVLKEGEPIGKGQEANIYLWTDPTTGEKSVWKVFPIGVKPETVQRNVEFLQNYSSSGHVPKYRNLHSVEHDHAFIKMDLIEGMTLSAFLKTEQAKGVGTRNMLLELLWLARLTLPHNIEFTDLKKLDNIMIRVNQLGVPVSVIFVEGGTEIGNTTNALTLFLDTMASLISALRSPFYQSRHLMLRQYLRLNHE